MYLLKKAKKEKKQVLEILEKTESNLEKGKEIIKGTQEYKEAIESLQITDAEFNKAKDQVSEPWQRQQWCEVFEKMVVAYHSHQKDGSQFPCPIKSTMGDLLYKYTIISNEE